MMKLAIALVLTAAVPTSPAWAAPPISFDAAVAICRSAVLDIITNRPPRRARAMRDSLSVSDRARLDLICQAYNEAVADFRPTLPPGGRERAI